jgi:hypothetical protein
MPFDPHYIPGEEAPLHANGDILLPDDLAELAQQLMADANYLAHVHSPVTPVEKIADHWKASSEQNALRNSRWIPLLSISLALLAICLTAWNLVSMQRPVSPVVAAEALWPNLPRVANFASEDSSAPEFAPTFLGPTQPVMFIDYSSPELEGVLDLLPPNEEEVSF